MFFRYVAITPLSTLLTTALVAAGALGEDECDSEGSTFERCVSTPFFWNYLILFVANSHCIYCLVLFFLETRELLEPTRPHAKFLVVKGVVFLTFFQNAAISFAFSVNKTWLHRQLPHKDPENVVGALRNMLMCVEMLGFALGHAVAFPTAREQRTRREVGDAHLFAFFQIAS